MPKLETVAGVVAAAFAILVYGAAIGFVVYVVWEIVT